jgi:hypothetical protein
MKMEEEKRFQFFLKEIRCVGASPYNPTYSYLSTGDEAYVSKKYFTKVGI